VPGDRKRKAPAATPGPRRSTAAKQVNADNVARGATVIPLADARQWRVERVDGQAGPYWPAWRCCWSSTTAEASRRAG
jgi:hypothetical protein